MNDRKGECKGLKSIVRRQTGTSLNVVKITYRMFYYRWMEIEDKLNNKLKGGE
ncbi:MAG: hypothetical protein AABX11_05790 [Nanoarchaeota archaeon]